jgi:hypothetical protein
MNNNKNIGQKKRKAELPQVMRGDFSSFLLSFDLCYLKQEKRGKEKRDQISLHFVTTS